MSRSVVSRQVHAFVWNQAVLAMSENVAAQAMPKSAGIVLGDLHLN